MTKATNYLIAAALAAFIAGPAAAQDLQYVGPHSNDPADYVDGGEGVIIYNRLCRQAFDEAQMCNSADVLRGGTANVRAVFHQWIKPSIVAAYSDGASNYMVDESGLVNSAALGQGLPNLSCSGWRNGSNNVTGLRVTPEGEFVVEICNQIAAVACCVAPKSKR